MVELKPGTPLDPAKLRKAIQKAGYESRDIEISLLAHVERRNDVILLRPAGISQTFAVRAGPAAADLEAFVGKTARVRGKLVAEEKSLELELVEVGSPGG